MTAWLAVSGLVLGLACPARLLAQPPAAVTPAGAETRDSVKDGVWKGALAGAGGMLALWGAAAKSCGTGCERSDTPAATAVIAVFGAAVGSVVGLAADLDAGPSHLVGVRAGPVFSRTAFRSALVDGSAGSPGFAAAVRVSPHISVHAEYTATDGQFVPAAGTVPQDVVGNVVPAASRAAGRSEWIERRRISYVFTQLVGVHPRPWGPLRLEFLGGLGVQGQENRNYYEAAVPGTYHVLDFKTPEIGLVLGVDAEIAIARHFALVPMLRYNQMGDPGASMAYGAGAHWRF